MFRFKVMSINLCTERIIYTVLFLTHTCQQSCISVVFSGTLNLVCISKYLVMVLDCLSWIVYLSKLYLHGTMEFFYSTVPNLFHSGGDHLKFVAIPRSRSCYWIRLSCLYGVSDAPFWCLYGVQKKKMHPFGENFGTVVFLLHRKIEKPRTKIAGLEGEHMAVVKSKICASPKHKARW